MIRAVSVMPMASCSGRARTKVSVSDTNGQVSQKSAPTSKVLCAMDSHFLTSDFRPDKDGTIDLTTPENDALYNAVGAHLTGRHPSSTGL